MLSGKLALITGAASGIGLEVSRLFAKNDAIVIMVDINEQVKTLVNDLEKPKDASKSHSAFQCDVSKSDQVDNLFENIQRAYPVEKIPNVIVNCAGIFNFRPLVDLTEKDFDQMMSINFKGTFLVSQKAAKGLISNFDNKNLSANSTYASIINISSLAAKISLEGFSHYSASKGAIESFTRCIAKELGKYKIRCNCIAPGMINTPILNNFPNGLVDAVQSQIHIGRIGEPIDIANLSLFLASENSSFVTGASYDCSGGF